MNARIEKFLKAEHLTPAKFADVIGVQRSSISHLISGRNKPSFDFIEKVLNHYPRINPEWLLLGKGEMYKQMIQTSLFGDLETIGNEPKRESIIDNQEANALSSSVDTRTENNKSTVNESPNNESISVSAYTTQNGKVVERVVVLYTDGSFKSYIPSSD